MKRYGSWSGKCVQIPPRFEPASDCDLTPSLASEVLAIVSGLTTRAAVLQGLWRPSVPVFAKARMVRGAANVRSCPRVPACPDPVPVWYPRSLSAAGAGNRTSQLQGFSLKPSDGLEPSTPSLPWRFRGGTGGHGRASAVTFSLQSDRSRRVLSVRACPRVLTLMYPSRTCGMLPNYKTGNGVSRQLVAISSRAE